MGTQTYARAHRHSLGTPFLLQLACRHGLIAAATWLLLFTAACSSNSDGSPFIPEASRALAASFASPEAAIAELQVRARTVAVRLHTDALVAELPRLEDELLVNVRALAALPDAAALPWLPWIEATWRILPNLAEQYMLCAEELLHGEAALQLIRTVDLREMPMRVRLVAHRMLWELDPNEALARGNVLLFRERPRADDRMRPLYVEELLVAATHPLALELLLNVATSDAMEPRARTLAIRALGNGTSFEAPAILESLFDTESTNFLVRKEALMSILKLDPPRAHHMLMDRLPGREHDPGLWEFMVTLRKQEGLPLPSEN
jgi:hypothetical protein